MRAAHGEIASAVPKLMVEFPPNFKIARAQCARFMTGFSCKARS